MFRCKPILLADALRLHGRAVPLDTDSFIGGVSTPRWRARSVRRGDENSFVRELPLSFFGAYETELPHLGHYRFDAEKALMLNSGLVARAEHLPLLDDAVILIDRLWAAGLVRHDLEYSPSPRAFASAGSLFG